MSLIRRQRLTKKNLAAKRSNASQGRGPATPAGKARSAAARLLHGFYSQGRDGAMLRWEKIRRSSRHSSARWWRIYSPQPNLKVSS